MEPAHVLEALLKTPSCGWKIPQDDFILTMQGQVGVFSALWGRTASSLWIFINLFVFNVSTESSRGSVVFVFAVY